MHACKGSGSPAIARSEVLHMLHGWRTACSVPAPLQALVCCWRAAAEMRLPLWWTAFVCLPSLLTFLVASWFAGEFQKRSANVLGVQHGWKRWCA